MLRKRTLGMFTAVLAIILVSTNLISAHPAAAAPSDFITTLPVSLNLPIMPGSSRTTTLQVLNNGTQTQTLSVDLESFGAYGVAETAAIQPFAAHDPAPSYVHFSQTTITAQPGVWKSITMTINLPKTATLGYYYAVIFKPQITTQTGQHANILTASDAILVLVDTHSTNELRQVQLSSFTATQKLYDFLPVTFNITIHNNGNIYLPPRGDVYITSDSKLKKVLAILSVNTAQGNVLPSSNRTFSVAWNDGFPVYVPETAHGKPVTDSTGQVVDQLKWDFSKTHKFRFGKYYAHLELVYNNGVRDIYVQSTLSFWIIPWKLITISLVVLIVFILGIYLIFKSVFRGGRKLFSNKDARKSFITRK